MYDRVIALTNTPTAPLTLDSIATLIAQFPLDQH